MWSTEADKAFNDIKWSITQAPILQLFGPKKETIIQSDASISGFGCTLIQDEKQHVMLIVLSQKPSPDTQTLSVNFERKCGL